MECRHCRISIFRLSNLENCTLNGRICGHSGNKYTNCKFSNANSDYCIWTYGSDSEFTNCTFTSNGKFINVYSVNKADYTVKASGCTFINTGGAKKSALNINGSGEHSKVIIESCAVEGEFPQAGGSGNGPIYSADGLWMVDDGPWYKDLSITVDGKEVFRGEQEL